MTDAEFEVFKTTNGKLINGMLVPGENGKVDHPRSLCTKCKCHGHMANNHPSKMPTGPVTIIDCSYDKRKALMDPKYLPGGSTRSTISAVNEVQELYPGQHTDDSEAAISLAMINELRGNFDKLINFAEIPANVFTQSMVSRKVNLPSMAVLKGLTSPTPSA